MCSVLAGFETTTTARRSRLFAALDSCPTRVLGIQHAKLQTTQQAVHLVVRHRSGGIPGYGLEEQRSQAVVGASAVVLVAVGLGVVRAEQTPLHVQHNRVFDDIVGKHFGCCVPANISQRACCQGRTGRGDCPPVPGSGQ